MAITFSKSLSESNFLNAYNNNIVEFSSDNVLDATLCEISINGYEIEITPINNLFRYNFIEYITVLINQNQFSDDIIPDLDTSYIYDDSGNTYLEASIDYTITFSDDNTETINKTYKFIKSVEQLEQNKLGVVNSDNNLFLLSPFQKATSNTYNVTYFEGYPFDLPFLLKNTGETTILNQTNGLSYSFDLDYDVSRLF